MEQGHKEKVPAPVEVWGLAALEREKVVVKEAVEDKAVVAVRGKEKVKVAVKHRGRAVDKISKNA